MRRYLRGELLARRDELLAIRALLLEHDLRAVEDELEDIGFLLALPEATAKQENRKTGKQEEEDA